MRRHYYDLMDDKAPLVIVKVAEAVASWSDEHLKTHIGALLCSAVHSARNSNNWVQSVCVSNQYVSLGGLRSMRWWGDDHWSCYQDQETGLETKSLNISRNLILWGLGLSVPQTSKPEGIYNPITAMGLFCNVYLSAGQHYEVNIAGTPLL